MSVSAVAGDWPVLVARLDRLGVTARWSSADPALRGVRTVDELKVWTTPGQPAAADAVLGALVRLGAVDGAGDADAALVLVHLLWPAMVRTVQDVRSTFGSDADAVVAAALVERIRAYPIGRRTRAFAANLQHDTRRMVISEAMARCREHPITNADLLTQARGVARIPDADADIDAHHLLRWAVRAGVVSAADVSLLRQLTSRAEPGTGGRRATAAALLGVSVRTVERRRDRALAALRAVLPHYLDDVAA